MKRSITRKLDKAFSLIIRSHGKCERCLRSGTVKLETSHVFSRANRAVRWEELNASCLCSGCHRWAHQNPVEFTEWVKVRLGEERYDELRKMATSVRKWTDREGLALLESMTAGRRGDSVAVPTESRHTLSPRG